MLKLRVFQVGLVAAIASAQAAVPVRASANGYVAQTCNVQDVLHYDKKGYAFMESGSWLNATWAYRAAWDSQATCKASDRSPAWAYWWNAQMAAAFYNLRKYDYALRFLSAADQWKTVADRVTLSAADKRAYAGAQLVTEQVRRGVGSAASSANNAASRPPAEYSVPSSAQGSCDTDSISEVARDGKVITTLEGKTYLIFEQYTVDTQLWLTADDLVICPTSNPRAFQIINKDEQEERAFGTLVNQ